MGISPADHAEFSSIYVAPTDPTRVRSGVHSILDAAAIRACSHSWPSLWRGVEGDAAHLRRPSRQRIRRRGKSIANARIVPILRIVNYLLSAATIAEM